VEDFMRLDRALLAGSTLLVGAVFFAMPSVAYAGIDACGDIDVRASATCKVETSGGCTAQCTPLSFEASCAAKLDVQCKGQCNASATVDCQGSCKADCSGKCSADPGSLDCSANCQASCEGDCSGKCSSSGNQSECEASCKGSCSSSCSAQCTGTPPSATCDAKCDASCKGSCSAEANVDCQISCQSKGYASCKADLQGGCTAKCSQPSGALFCDGQYVDTGDNLQKCIDALNAILNVKVSASGSAECSGNECSAQGKASASCNAAPSEAPTANTWLLAGLGAIVSVVVRRRKSR
jgi:hypothetical protein